MRRAAKIDRTQPEIVAALRQAGCFVQSLAAVGDGCPDLLVGRAGTWFCLEVKDWAQPPSKRALTAPEAFWHGQALGRGPVFIVESVEQALQTVGVR